MMHFWAVLGARAELASKRRSGEAMALLLSGVAFGRGWSGEECRAGPALGRLCGRSRISSPFIECQLAGNRWFDGTIAL